MAELFDARRTMLIDERRPVCDRRVVSLVSALRVVVAPSVPHLGDGSEESGAALEAAREVLGELERRGIDGEHLVRFGLAREIVASVLVLLLPRWMAEVQAGAGDAVLPGAAEARATAWHAVLPTFHIPPELPADFGTLERKQDIEHLVDAVTRHVFAWVLTAPLDDLLALTPPAEVVSMTTVGPAPPEPAVMEEYRWMVERFSETHLQDWTTASLHLEHQWLRGNHPAPCSEDAMQDRVVASAELNGEIARRAADPRKNDSSLTEMGFRPALAGRMINQAMAFLRDGRFAEAAALFRFASREDDADALAANNLGFCLVPKDPREALEHLTRAQDLGFASAEINAHNRAVCLFLNDDPRGALRIIADVWNGLDEGKRAAALWRVGDDGSPALAESVSVRDELARLAGRCAFALGDLRAANLWNSRLQP